MSVIMGYRKRPDKNWIFILIAAVFIFVVALVIFSVMPEKKEIVAKNVQKNTEKTTPPLKETTKESFATEEKTTQDPDIQIKDMKINYNSAENRIYLFTSFSCKTPPKTIYHKWVSPSQKKEISIPLILSRDESETWSYIYAEENGIWSVFVLDSQNKKLGEKKFSFPFNQ